MKKYGIAIVISILLSLLVMVLSLATRPDVALPEEYQNDSVSVLSSVSLTPVNAMLRKDLAFLTVGDDAQLYIEGIDVPIGALIVDFTRPLPEGTTCQLYYAADGMGLSEGSSIKLATTDETDKLVLRLPGIDDYDVLRLDIDENYKLEDLAVIKDEAALYTGDSYLSAMLAGRVAFPLEQFAICLFVLACEALLVAWKLDAIRRGFERFGAYVRENRKRLLRAFLTCLAGAILGWLVWTVLCRLEVCHSRSGYSAFYFAVSGLMAGALIAVRRRLGDHPEAGFLIIALCVGALFSVMEPAATGMSWDDETHYAKAVSLSYGNTSFISNTEYMVANFAVPNDMTLDNKLTTTRALNAGFNPMHGDYKNWNSHITYSYIPSYLPMAGAIWLTRLVGLPFSAIFIAGRLANLLCYACAMCFAIRQLKRGRLFVAAVGLIPTALFLAGNYSYDMFCLAFIMLGVCIWLGVYQTPGGSMTPGKAAGMLVSFAIGILAKAVYFPIALIALFLPNDRFASRAAARRYRLAVIAVAVLLAASFAVPFLIGDGGGLYTDTRGGSDVNAKGQVMFILGHPVQYAKILVSYMVNTYFSYGAMMSGVGGCIRAFSYLSNMGIIFPELLACLLLAFMFTAWLGSSDGPLPGAYPNAWVKLAAAVVAFGTLCIAATSLYCAYTPVGSSTIGGFQERYMLPVMVPLLVVLRPDFLKNRIPRVYFNAIVLCAEGAILVAGLWPMARVFLG